MNFEIFFTLFETALLFINRIRIFNKAHIFQKYSASKKFLVETSVFFYFQEAQGQLSSKIYLRKIFGYAIKNLYVKISILGVLEPISVRKL